MRPEVLVAVVAAFVAISLAAGAAMSWLLTVAAPEQRRLRAMVEPASGAARVLSDDTRLTHSLDPTLARLSAMLPKSPKEMSRLQRRLARAGFTRYSAVIYYSVAEITLPIILFFAAVFLLGWGTGLIAGFVLAVIGYVTPSFFVEYYAAERRKAIRNGLPDALDLLTVCVEAGSSLDRALARTSEELMLPHPALAEELRMITTEIRAGKPRIDALRNFATRTGVDDARTLVSMLVQTDRFGTSIADALRTHSDTARTKRRQAAEERAGKVGVKLVFPLALCLFPALYVVCFGPVVISIYHALFETP